MRLGTLPALGLLSLGLVVGLSGGPVAQGGGAALVEQRQDTMKKMGGALFGQIGKIVRGENPNVTEAAAQAASLDEMAKNLTKMFPANTDRTAISTSRAKPEVWAQWSEFEAAANNFSAETGKLAQVAKGGDLEAIKAQFAPTTRACGGCHEAKAEAGGKFRFEKQ